MSTRRAFLNGTAAAAAGSLLPAAAAVAVSPDAALLALGAQLDAACAEEGAAWKVVEVIDADDDDPEYVLAQRLNRATAAVVDQIEEMRATTLAGIQVKVRAMVWCRVGEPFEGGDFEVRGDLTTDRRLLVGMMNDLWTMAGSAVA